MGAPDITSRYAICSCARRSHSNAGSSWPQSKTRTVAYSKMRSSFLLKSVAVHGTTMQIVTLNFSLVPEAFVMVMGCYSEAFVIVMLF